MKFFVSPPFREGWRAAPGWAESDEHCPPPPFGRPLPQAGGETGFTLVELMVVIVIIGLLATIVAINVLPSLGKANTTKARADIQTLDQAIEHYRLDTNQYPSADQGLRVLAEKGGYIKKLPNDPWGRPYIYTFPGQHGAYDIASLGADGQPGGTGENADIGSWQ